MDELGTPTQRTFHALPLHHVRFEKRKRKYGGRIKKVRQDLADFLDAFESQARVRRRASSERTPPFPGATSSTATMQETPTIRMPFRQWVGWRGRRLKPPEAPLDRVPLPRGGGSRPMSSGTTGLTGTISARCLGKTLAPWSKFLGFLDVLRSDKPVAGGTEDGKLVFQRRRRTLAEAVANGGLPGGKRLVCRFPSRTTFGL